MGLDLVAIFAGLYCFSLAVFSSPVNVATSFRKNGFVIDSFKWESTNDLGAWHGPGENMSMITGDGFVRFSPTDPDQNYHTQLSSSCLDMIDYRNMYLHVVFSGTEEFSISLNQHNVDCDSHRAPYPETWDSVEASRYANGTDIYVPLTHFAIDQSRVLSVSFHGFYTRDKLTLRKVEIVPHVPRGFPSIPRKLPTGRLVLRCLRPNSFAFGIDDGQPGFAQEAMRILKEEDILVTFFIVGNSLENSRTNFSDVYEDMMERGHQIALHSYTHPKMEGLSTTKQIDREIVGGIKALDDVLGIKSLYFRPPYGTIGARSRQRLAHHLKDPYIVNWSVDIEDWLWADSDTPEKQLEAFQRDIDQGGNLVVMHYLNPTTVGYFRDVIRMAKATGKRIMRVDQCMMDPEAPPLLLD